jgi:hypothetical protein
VAGAYAMPKRPVCGAGQGDRREEGTSSICSTVSPATATHGMAQADAGAFLTGAPADLLVQSIIADAAGGAAIAIVSQSGPSRTSNITAKTKNAMECNILGSGRARRFIGCI